MTTNPELLADQIRAGGRTTSTMAGLRITRLDGTTMEIKAVKGHLNRDLLHNFAIILAKAGYRSTRTLSMSVESHIMKIAKR
jgi:hypothetical protein